MATYQTQLQPLGYNFDPQIAVGYKKMNGFSFFVQVIPAQKICIISANCRPQDEQGIVELNKYLQQFSADRKNTVNLAAFDKNTIKIVYRMGMTTNIANEVKEATDAITYFINQCACIPVCPVCGQYTDTSIYSIGGNIVSLCNNCFCTEQSHIMTNVQKEQETVTNFPLGILGAALGGLAGAVIWIIASMLGYIVWISGVISGFLGIAAFQKFGKKLNVPGIIVSGVISFAMLLCGMYFALAIDVYNTFSVDYAISFSDSFKLIPWLLQDDKILGALIADWSIGVIGFFVSYIICIAQFFKNRKIKTQAVKLL